MAVPEEVWLVPRPVNTTVHDAVHDAISFVSALVVSTLKDVVRNPFMEK